MTKTPEDPGEHFDALALIDGSQELPALVKRSARKVCETCALYPEASPVICKHCPLPEFLNQLKKELNQ